MSVSKLILNAIPGEQSFIVNERESAELKRVLATIRHRRFAPERIEIKIGLNQFIEPTDAFSSTHEDRHYHVVRNTEVGVVLLFDQFGAKKIYFHDPTELFLPNEATQNGVQIGSPIRQWPTQRFQKTSQWNGKFVPLFQEVGA